MRTLIFATVGLLVAVSRIQAGELHVAMTGQDTSPGTPAAPLRTIQHAADLAQPGDTITVHAGVYRERINPPRGGESDARRITYQAAPGEKVEIKGSEVVKGWEKVQGDVWKITLPNSFFGKFNPYSDLIHGDWFSPGKRQHHTGAVYLNGLWLVEAATLEQVLAPSIPGSASSDQGPLLMNVAWFSPEKASSPGKPIPAVGYSDGEGIKKAPASEGGQCIGWINPGDWVRYDAVDFGDKTRQIKFRVASNTQGGQIEIRLDSQTGPLLGICSVPNTGGWQQWSTHSAAIKPVSGIQKLCLRFIASPCPGALDKQLWFAQVDDTNTTITAQFPGLDPNTQLTEINVRQSVFYPDKPFRNYITVRGFTMRDAATPWAPPTAEQIGLIGTHWSKGWIIENNTISHSLCSGITLGKYGDEFDNKAGSASGYVGTINRALKNGWNKETIGHHLVRNNHISHCEQVGIVGSMGAAFSTVTGNAIHDIHVRRLFSGAEMAGIKFHGPVDVEISKNHIYRTCTGIWLDWMTQGARISRNLMHDNGQDMGFEVNHGPILVDNNLFLSGVCLFNYTSEGVAFAHNLVTGALIEVVNSDGRKTPLLKAHSVEIAELHDCQMGDAHYYNNLIIQRADLSKFDLAKLPVAMAGNVFLKGAKPSTKEADPVVLADMDPAIRLEERSEGWFLEMDANIAAWAGQRPHPLVTTELLGKTVISNQRFEQPDGSPIRINTDYLGKPRNEANPAVGPFEKPEWGKRDYKVW